MYKANLYINSLRGDLPVFGQGVRLRPMISCEKRNQDLLFSIGFYRLRVISQLLPSCKYAVCSESNQGGNSRLAQKVKKKTPSRM